MRVVWSLQRSFLGLLVLNMLFACASPAQRIDKIADKFGFERKLISSNKFQHVVYFSHSFKKQASKHQSLHIYIEGDGLPWLQRQVVAADPTPRNPLALKLMAHDNQSSVYIGRPCYFGFSRSEACNPLLWTHQRYGQVIVDSIVEVANKIIIEQEPQRVILIGYSGGGVLAMLMAEKIQRIDSIITIAANLDIEAWAKLHDYSLLEGSLNPATQAPLRREIQQWHLVGNEDINVPPELVQTVVNKQVGSSKLISFDGFDHICCWSEQWSKILSSLH